MKNDRKSDTKSHTPVYDFSIIRCPEQANPEGQNIDQWLTWAGAEETGG